MSNGFIGEIRTFAFGFAPRNFMMCNGQTLNISQYNALFALLGTTYGGNGQSTFNLPDLRSRVPLHIGQGQGLSSYFLGQRAGTEAVTLTTNQLPAHTHAFTGTLNAVTTKATALAPAAGSQFARGADAAGTDNPQIYVPAGTSGTNVALGGLSGMNAIVGANQAVPILQPYLALNFCIQMQGVFPSRN